MGGAYFYSNSGIDYIAPITIEKEVIKETIVSDIDVRIKQAQDSARAEVETKAQSAYNKAYEQAMLEIELEVTSKFRGEIEEREKVLQESSSAY